jgi:ketol-acid reductoisomerase
MRIITEREIEGRPLDGKTVAVIGYGNQGEAQALNLRDAGVTVLIGLKEGSPSSARATAAGFDVVTPAEAARAGDVLPLMVPDELIPRLMTKVVEPEVREGAALVFAHGFPVRFGGVSLPERVDAVLVAPMGPGARLRERFVAGGGLPASIAIARDATGGARRTALEYAKAIGCARAGLFETTFAEETEIDLFAEQAVLCGGVTRLVTAAFDTLVEAGYPPELAYLECVYELDLTVNLIRRYGISGMRERISGTALYGDLTRGDRVIGPEVKAGMRRVLGEIRDGTFASEFASESRGEGSSAALRRERGRLIEEVGKRLGEVVREPGESEST